ncbi:MAG TPA: hypothetical protein PLY96_11770 [Chromatiaceae bacterium]|jgi:hypothetical protein|nr:hypothetical protein [Chromatiaceae bacterium]
MQAEEVGLKVIRQGLRPQGGDETLRGVPMGKAIDEFVPDHGQGLKTLSNIYI